MPDTAHSTTYSPSEEIVARAHVDAKTYEAMYKASIDDPDTFWAKEGKRVDMRVGKERVMIHITDEGPGFKPDDVPDPTLDENLDVPSGRGVMLIKAYMTEVSYNEKGNSVKMVKDRNA